MRILGSALVVGATVLLATGCSGPAAPVTAPRGTVTVTQTATAASDTPSAPATTSQAAATTAAVAPTTGAPDQVWTMPDLRGKDLQTAQDAIQSLTQDKVFFTTSHDATGAGRHQILDRDWQVCTQSVAPGASFASDAAIDFGVVRIGSESCPR